MKRLSWIVTLPLLLVVVVFSVANLHRVAVKLWPLGWYAEVPLSWLLLGTLFVGFLAGALVAWLSAHKSRQRAREQRSKSSRLEREVIHLQREAARVRQQADGPATDSPESKTPTLPAVAAGR